MNNKCNKAVTHTDVTAVQNVRTFEKRLDVGISYFNQAKTNLCSLSLKIKLDFSNS
jgi:hypothetical protein